MFPFTSLLELDKEIKTIELYDKLRWGREHVKIGLKYSLNSATKDKKRWKLVPGCVLPDHFNMIIWEIVGQSAGKWSAVQAV